MKIIAKKIIKNRSNDNTIPVKTYYTLLEDEDLETGIIIDRYILTPNIEYYMEQGYKPLRIYKNKCLLYMSIGFTISTWKEINTWITDNL